MPAPLKTALVIEPNEALATPYHYLAKSLQLIRVNNVPEALRLLNEQTPSLFFVSTSFAPSLQLELLEALKNSFTDTIIPLVFVVDLSQPISYLPGTVWGEKLAILHSHQTATIIKALIQPLL